MFHHHPSSQLPVSGRDVGRGRVQPQRGGLVRHRGDDRRVLDGEAVHRLAQLLAADDVGRLRVQLAHVLLLEAQREALHLRQLAAGLQHHEDADQAQQQVDCRGRRKTSRVTHEDKRGFGQEALRVRPVPTSFFFSLLVQQ